MYTAIAYQNIWKFVNLLASVNKLESSVPSHSGPLRSPAHAVIVMSSDITSHHSILKMPISSPSLLPHPSGMLLHGSFCSLHHHITPSHPHTPISHPPTHTAHNTPMPPPHYTLTPTLHTIPPCHPHTTPSHPHLTSSHTPTHTSHPHTYSFPTHPSPHLYCKSPLLTPEGASTQLDRLGCLKFHTRT